MKTDMQSNFEFYMKDYGLDFSMDDYGEYVKKKTRFAYEAFCIGVRVGEMC